MASFSPNPASFRDPSGVIYELDGLLLRQVNRRFAEAYDAARDQGIYASLIADGLLIPHTEASTACALTDEAHVVLQPERVPFVSYPYEWCFSQLKDAALLTLELQRRLLAVGWGLRDASAFNVQFYQGRPVLIDTLSIAPLPAGAPWVAYKQFCQHFLAPLLLMSRVDIRLNGLLQRQLDGIPLDLASRLLPVRSWMEFGPLAHLHLHARSIAKYAHGRGTNMQRARVMSRSSLEALTESLRGVVQNAEWTPAGTEWADYATEHNYSDAAFLAKRQLVAEVVARLQPNVVWDLGANIGTFSRIATEAGAFVLSIDSDPAAVDRNYRQARADGNDELLPLLVDLNAPSPAVGWSNVERATLSARGTPDLLLALALIHHLAISGNLPLERISDYFASLAPHLLLEFVAKEDSQVQRMLSTREDVFPSYTPQGFEAAFARRWAVISKAPVPGTARTLYLLARRDT